MTRTSGPLRTLCLLASILAAEPLAAQTPSGFLNSYRDVGPAITRCWRPPAGSQGMELTLIFSLKRDGSVLGEPRISYSKLTGDEDLQKTFVASVLRALADCTPLHLSEGLGGALAGRPFAMRFRLAPRQSPV